MTTIRVRFSITADGDLDADIGNCLTDEAIAGDFVSGAAFALRNAIAEYLDVPQRYIDYDFEIDD